MRVTRGLIKAGTYRLIDYCRTGRFFYRNCSDSLRKISLVHFWCCPGFLVVAAFVLAFSLALFTHSFFSLFQHLRYFYSPVGKIDQIWNVQLTQCRSGAGMLWLKCSTLLLQEVKWLVSYDYWNLKVPSGLFLYTNRFMFTFMVTAGHCVISWSLTCWNHESISYNLCGAVKKSCLVINYVDIGW